MFVLTTNGITISVETSYLAGHSDVLSDRFAFGYHITIENGSPYTVQLLKRKWVIIDSVGVLKTVEGEGVVGEQPILAPGDAHQYTSFCNFVSEMGKMRGTYLMVRKSDNTYFEVEIPEFFMCAPFKLN